MVVVYCTSSRSGWSRSTRSRSSSSSSSSSGSSGSSSSKLFASRMASVLICSHGAQGAERHTS